MQGFFLSMLKQICSNFYILHHFCVGEPELILALGSPRPMASSQPLVLVQLAHYTLGKQGRRKSSTKQLCPIATFMDCLVALYGPIHTWAMFALSLLPEQEREGGG